MGVPKARRDLDVTLPHAGVPVGRLSALAVGDRGADTNRHGGDRDKMDDNDCLGTSLFLTTGSVLGGKNICLETAIQKNGKCLA